MAWALLCAAGLAEIGMALALKQSAGWTRWWPSLIGIALALGSFFLLTLAMQRLPMATAYAAWTGIGAIGVAVAGMLFFGESGHPWRLLCLAAILAGIIGLRLLEA
jgi:quaternary ammonium compound-resistance protein SugE